ncbi:kinase-like protein [Gigaspora margarita]|uniref:Kinase-like protein n=1 Tax=Gigaspora margarita TaxID=4874 RepID=A0A8H3X6K8_GIGMA|nr:kinase-like protein [Gigaspora margarita]
MENFKSAITTVAEIVALYVPLVGSVNLIAREINHIYENAECNKEICLIMTNRVKTAEYAIETMMRNIEDNEENIRKKEYYLAFQSFINVLQKVKDYTENVAKLKGYKKFLNANDVRTRYEKLTDEYNKCMNDLQFTLAIVHENQRNSDAKKVTKALTDVQAALTNLEGMKQQIDMIAQEISIIKSQKTSDVHAHMINPNELSEPLQISKTDFRGSDQLPISRKFYKGGVEVACKPIRDPNKKLEAELAILKKLVTDILRWMSPELIKKYKQNKYEERVYTFNCEIFSFGMLMWELCYETLPYKDFDANTISEHVLIGKREKLFLEKLKNLSDKEIQKEFTEIIDKTWHHTPHQRIALTNLHSILEALAVKYPTSPTQTPLQDKPKNFVRPMGEENSSVCFEMPVTPLEKGIQFHQAKDYKNAWKCFEENANLGNVEAKYWQGYYYYYGHNNITKDIKLAKKLFKEAADNNHIIAQVRYAVALLSDLRKDDDEATKEDNRNQILHYFKLAAEKENADAMYYLGDIYVHGKLKVQQNNENRDLGIKYLKLAADNNHENAKKLLKQLRIKN